MTRRFCDSLNACDASTSNTASTRVSDFCACWPPGPLDRDVRSTISDRGTATLRVTRIDSAPVMAAILLDVDGVLHVSGEAIPGAADAVRRLRENGHRLRFVTNTTVRPRAQLAELLRTQGIELEDEEVQTTAQVAVKVLRGRRVLALTMHALVHDLEGLELVGEGAEAVLIGGADETPETGLVFSYMNLARAFSELEMGARLYCLHRNRWWQTKRGPLLDSGAFVAGLEYAANVEATVLGKPSSQYFEAALEALDADPQMTWMVGDDFEIDVAGAQRVGMRTVLLRTGKFRPDEIEASGTRPDGIVSSIAQLPAWLEEHL
jgi:HAD superfamily hydrolase (TIGR01458 family)